MSTPSVGIRELPDGLVLRGATPADLPGIQELLVDRGESADARDLELMVTDPDAGWDLCAVVVDGDQVVSTASLMDEQVRIGGATLPAGQVELVATRTGYEGRGLVRELMRWMHELSASRGHLLQVMIGIPYFYRLFGYEYAIDIPKARTVIALPELPGGHDLRPAGSADLPALAALQEQAQTSFDVTVPHSRARRRWLLSHDSSVTYVLERDRHAVATARVQADDSAVLLAEAAAVDHEASDALLAHVGLLRPGAPVTVVDRIGTVPSTAWATRLAAPDDGATQYYVRIADPGPLLDALRPVLFQRLRGLERPVDELVISTFGRHYRLAVEADGLAAVRVGGAMQAPASAGGIGVAPDQLGALLFGPQGMAGLSATRPDVYPGPHRQLFDALFPPLTADLLTFYLPY